MGDNGDENRNTGPVHHKSRNLGPVNKGGKGSMLDAIGKKV